MNPKSIEDRRKLMTTVGADLKVLEPHRRKRKQLLDKLAGSEYGDGSAMPTPFNHLAQQMQVHIQQLAGGEPQALVLASSDQHEMAAYDQSRALNKEAKRLRMRAKLHRLIRDAMVGVGIAKVGMVHSGYLHTSEELPIEGDPIPLGELSLETISLDNFVLDTRSDDIERLEYCGHRYWVLKEDLDQYLGDKTSEDTSEDEKAVYDGDGNERATTISRGTDTQWDETRTSRVWLWDLWLPRENVIITVPVDGTGVRAKVRKWKGPRRGRYHFLYFDEIPDQVIPKADLADVVHLHDSMNSTFRKLDQMCRDYKMITGVRQGFEDDGTSVRDAKHGDTVAMRDTDSVKPITYNGPDQAMLAVFLQTRDLASLAGGNTDAMGGLGQQGDTLGQEQIIKGAANQRIQSRQIATATLTVELFEAIRWHLWHDQMVPIPFTKENPYTGHKLQASWSAMDAEETDARFDDFEDQIEPYSLVYKGPEQRIQQLVELWERILMPALQTGTLQEAPDLQALLGIFSRYMNLPEVKQITNVVDPEMMQQMGGGDGPRQSPVTTRNYVRQGKPGMSRQGATATMTQQLIAGANQQGGGA